MAQTGRQRPLVGEPLAIDLLNTRWVLDGVPGDLLEDLDGLRQWLEEAPLAPAHTPTTVMLEHTRETRDLLSRLVAEPVCTTVEERLNTVLGHGSVRRLLHHGVPGSFEEFDDPSWGPAWLAVDNYLTLLERRDRIRACANPGCVLHFFDTSKNGSRRWCSMAGCGNRAKAARHLGRSRATSDG
ncbi:CGNR zinc finger domain-containing protein [Spiractinospora alimapuensis]|uniref:CGNR zinc finger domain-containing protein n=1 Tax=Spiractinospora alimapuensis TaxID=2820884 RepID=UPI001F323500|nr:CGNR zinc finger domain-containing protein [Spiractinospora alimapuensis]QVQ51802.1 CGNR zinc finger domain-containing protein [Spiractinospora alimapuensis]